MIQLRDSRFVKVWAEAWEAGCRAGLEATPRPMIVQDTMTGKVYEPIMDGVCGFAWINIKPATHPFCRWLKANGHARKDDYYGGITIWVNDHGQSYERKIAHAKAMADVIGNNINGLKYVLVNGRLD